MLSTSTHLAGAPPAPKPPGKRAYPKTVPTLCGSAAWPKYIVDENPTCAACQQELDKLIAIAEAEGDQSM